MNPDQKIINILQMHQKDQKEILWNTNSLQDMRVDTGKSPKHI